MYHALMSKEDNQDDELETELVLHSNCTLEPLQQL